MTSIDVARLFTPLCRSFINVPFLNLLSNIVDRAGSVNLRLGGNTQEFATYEDDIPDNNGKALGKETLDSNNPVRPACLSSYRMVS